MKFIAESFEPSEFRDRLGRLRAAMRAEGLDGILINSPEDIFYLTGFDSCGYYSYQHLMVGLDEGSETLLTRIVEIGIVQATPGVRNAVYWADRDDYIALGAELARKAGLGNARIGVQESSLYLKVNDYRRLTAALSGAKLVDASAILPRLRLVKSPAEVDCMRRAGAITDIGLEAALAAIAEGRRECEIAAAACAAMYAAGGVPPAYPGTFTSGPRTCFLHGMATERDLRRGDLVVLEPMGCFRRYNTNAIRTASLGPASSKAQDAHRLMEESVAACTEMVRPGVVAQEIDRRSRRIHERYARNRLHRTGYSLEVGYSPGFVGAMDLREGDLTPLEAGMVISIEPNTTFPDEGWGVQLGNCILVTATGHEVLHRTPTHMHVV
jgi:Xaa-Pro dipeptidase